LKSERYVVKKGCFEVRRITKIGEMKSERVDLTQEHRMDLKRLCSQIRHPKSR
jgi:hypothetical protein